MVQILLVIISIALTAAVTYASLTYGPTLEPITQRNYTQVTKGFTTLENSYATYTSANNGAAPSVASSAPDGGLSTNFSSYLPFLPPPPDGYQWSYGYNSSVGRNWFCLYSTSGGASQPEFTAFVRAQRVLSSSQYIIGAGAQSGCGATSSIDTSSYTGDVSLTYYVANVAAFSPLSIPGLVLWLDGADPSSMVLSNNAVAQWNDKSGNGNNAIQSTAANRPQYLSAGLQGSGALQFTRANTDYIEIPSSASLRTSQLDAFVVANTTANGSQSTFFTSDAMPTWSSPYDAYMLAVGTSPVAGAVQFSAAMTGGSAYAVQPASTSSAVNATSLFEGGYNGTQLFVGQGGLLTSASASGTPNTANGPFDIGRAAPSNSAAYLDGSIGEIVVYNRALTTLERVRLQHYFGSKWAMSALNN